MNKAWITVLAGSLALATPVLAGSSAEKCAADVQTCLNNWSKVRHAPWVGLDYDKSQPGVLKVKAVTPNSPAERAGFQPGDVLVALNGASMNDKAALKTAKGEWRVGQAVLYTVRRGTEESRWA